MLKYLYQNNVHKEDIETKKHKKGVMTDAEWEIAISAFCLKMLNTNLLFH